MRTRKTVVTLGLLTVWLVGQMPWVLGLFFMLHGSHEATAAHWNDRVVVVFSHQPAESNSEHNHDDHTVSFSVKDNYLRRATSDIQRLLWSAPVVTFHVLPAPNTSNDAAVQPNPTVDHAPHLFALRTIVLMV